MLEQLRRELAVRRRSTRSAASRYTEWIGAWLILLVICAVPASPAMAAVPMRPWLAHAPGARLAAGPQRILHIATEGEGQVTTGDGGVTCSLCVQPYLQGRVALVEARPAAHFEFAHWSGDCVGSATRCAVTMDRGAHVQAVFARAVSYLDVFVSGPGTIVSQPPGIRCGTSGDACAAPFGEDTLVRLTAEPALGGAFHSWGDDCSRRSLGAACSLVAGSRAEATATFRRSAPVPGASPLSVTPLAPEPRVTSVPAGIDCRPTCSASFASGTEVTLQAPLSAWRGGCHGTSTACPLIVDGPIDVAVMAIPPASPTLGFGVNVSVSGPGLVSGGSIRCGTTTGRLLDCEHSFPRGATVTLRATPRRRFAGWSGGFCTGHRPTCSIQVTAAKTILARFRR